MFRCDGIVAKLRSQLSSSFELEEMNGKCIVHTPFLYPDNTVVAIQIDRSAEGIYQLSDDGTAYEYAWISGVSNQLLESTAAAISLQFGVAAEGGRIVKEIHESALLQGMVDSITATQRIAETVVNRSTTQQRASFRRKIETYLVVNDRSYERDVFVQGRTAKRKVDYRIVPSGSSRQLALFQISRQTRLDRAESVAFRVSDILASRDSSAPSMMKLAILIEDGLGDLPPELLGHWQSILSTVRGTDAETFLWSERSKIDNLLAA